MTEAQIKIKRTESLLMELIPEAFSSLNDARLHDLSVLAVKCSKGRSDAKIYLDPSFYEDDEKKSTYSAHYTIDGQALIRSGLRYPLSSLHIRSGFGWRRHPVTGHRKMHRGIDLIGKIGRPVHAVADGKVIQSSYNPIAGNKIAIKHRDGSVSYYLHLNKRSVNKGAWVKSYQIIGTVGKTGRVTGAHLHFGFKQANGKWINPLNKRMIATPKLTGEKLASLKNQVLQIKGMLADIKIKSNAPYIASKQTQKKETNFLESIWPI